MKFFALSLAVCVAVLSKVAESAIATNVLLISVDGLHQSDLDWYVKNYPVSAMATLLAKGTQFTKAHTAYPSDSFPGMVGIATGGNPSSTGVYYDDSWSNDLLPAGTTVCATGATLGAEVSYTEFVDKTTKNTTSGWALDAGQGLSGLPGSILQMTGKPRNQINPLFLPVDPLTCKPVYPYQYLKVNTIFEVAREANMRTAWCDKHPAYDILNGPSGSGIQDLFTPEINSDAPTVGSTTDWTKDNLLTQQYDGFKVAAVLNQIKGFDHSGTNAVGVPNIYGMNFQSVSTAQKLPALVANVVTGGYLADGVTPGPLLTNALIFVDSKLAAMQSAIASSSKNASTVIILTAKHGQSPKIPASLIRIKDSTIMTALNAAWAKKSGAVKDLVALTANDNGMQIWLSNRTAAAVQFAKLFIMSYSGVGTTISPPYATRAFNSSGLVSIYAGKDACTFYGVSYPDGRAPDIVGISAYGVVYTGGVKKISEHGGFNTEDRNVPIVVSGSCLPKGNAGVTITSNVMTTQVGPTILSLLGLDPYRLAAVQIEKTAVLPILYTATVTATTTTTTLTSSASTTKSLAASIAGLSLTLSTFFFM